MLIWSYPGQPDGGMKHHFVRGGDAAPCQSETGRPKAEVTGYYGKEMVMRGLYLDGEAQDRLVPSVPNRRPQP